MKMGYAWQEALSALNEPGDNQTHPIYRVRQWQIGAALYLAGNILQFLSFAFAAQSLLLALSSAQFGTHLLFAWLMEGVHVPMRSIMGAAIIISFNILLVIFSSKASKLLSADELLDLFRKPQYIAYQVIGAITCITAALAYHTTSTTNSRLSKRFPVIMSARPALLALAAAIPGTQALLHGKCLAMMFVITLGQSNQMSHWFFWVAGFVQASASALWTASLTHGMNVFPTVIVLPILQVVYTLVGIICGSVFFQEWKDMSTMALCMYAVGFMGMAAGIRVGISPEDLAEGLEQLHEGDQTDSDEDIASDDGSVASSNSSGEQTQRRRTTFAPRKSMHAALAKTRSSIHATALTSLGLGGNKKLRCASVFVSPMALGAMNLPESSERRITIAQEAAQRRRTTLASTGEANKNPLFSNKNVKSSSEDDEDSTQGDRRSSEAENDYGATNSPQKAKHRSKSTEPSRQGPKLVKPGSVSPESVKRFRENKSKITASRADGSSKVKQGTSKHAHQVKQSPGKIVTSREIESKDKGKGNRRVKGSRGTGDEGRKVHSHGGWKPDRRKHEAVASSKEPDSGNLHSHDFRSVEGDQKGLPESSTSMQLTTQQVSLTRAPSATPDCTASPKRHHRKHQKLPGNYYDSAMPEESANSRSEVVTQSVSQLEVVMRGSFTSPPAVPPTPHDVAHLPQVVVSYPEQNPNSADTSLHASQHPSSQIAADGQNTTYNPKNPYYTSHPQHQQQQYQDHSVQSSSDQHHQERAGSPKPPYPGQNRPYQHKDPHQEERRAPTPHSLLPPQAATPAHPYMLSASPHHAQDVTLRNKDNEGPYEPGALLQATSHLRRLSFELANHGLNSQSAGAAGPAVLHGLQQLHNNVNSAPQLQFGNMNVQTSSQQPPGGTGHGAAQRQAPRRFAGDPGARSPNQSSPHSSPSLSPAITPAASPHSSIHHLRPQPAQPPQAPYPTAAPFNYPQPPLATNSPLYSQSHTSQSSQGHEFSFRDPAYTDQQQSYQHLPHSQAHSGMPHSPDHARSPPNPPFPPLAVRTNSNTPYASEPNSSNLPPPLGAWGPSPANSAMHGAHVSYQALSSAAAQSNMSPQHMQARPHAKPQLQQYSPQRGPYQQSPPFPPAPAIQTAQLQNPEQMPNAAYQLSQPPEHYNLNPHKSTSPWNPPNPPGSWDHQGPQHTTHQGRDSPPPQPGPYSEASSVQGPQGPHTPTASHFYQQPYQQPHHTTPNFIEFTNKFNGRNKNSPPPPYAPPQQHPGGQPFPFSNPNPNYYSNPTPYQHHNANHASQPTPHAPAAAPQGNGNDFGVATGDPVTMQMPPMPHNAQRESAASMASVVAHAGVPEDTPGLSWLHSQVPQ